MGSRRRRVRPPLFDALPETESLGLAGAPTWYLADLEELGSHFGGKDHTTMLYSIRKIEKLLVKNASIRADVERLTREITGK